jgi:hypothetical protein
MSISQEKKEEWICCSCLLPIRSLTSLPSADANPFSSGKLSSNGSRIAATHFFKFLPQSFQNSFSMVKQFQS